MQEEEWGGANGDRFETFSARDSEPVSLADLPRGSPCGTSSLPVSVSAAERVPVSVFRPARVCRRGVAAAPTLVIHSEFVRRPPQLVYPCVCICVFVMLN